MGRQLTESERALVTAMIERASVNDGNAVTPEDRRRWLGQVDDLRVVGTCGCGTCPSIEFVSGDDVGNRLWLEAWDNKQNAGILLFVDNGALSYLEVYPADWKEAGESVALPRVSDVDFYEPTSSE
ncbi:MAG: hypothetical protein MR006_03845 [Arcanobacterium sp.]|nr:hypothetical protein [Arcanobacterium sp.]MDY5588581.1 hypothetical protein [Arcanobacterium sp.]